MSGRGERVAGPVRTEGRAPDRTCLLVAYYYPPGGGVGVQRALKFTKYLPSFGWRPVVLTPDTPVGIPADPTLAIPPGVVLYRAAPTIRFASCFAANRPWLVRLLTAAVLVPDPMVGWLPAAIRRGLEAIKREKPEVIFATSPPHSSQLLGWALSRLSGLPLVSDFRDAWLTDPDRNGSFHNRARIATVEKLMEWLVLRYASQVISVSDAILDDFRARYPRIPPATFSLIENGFDEDDLENFDPLLSLGEFAIVLTGSMDKPNRAAAPLLRGVAALLATRPDLRSRVRIHLVGPPAASDRELTKVLDLESVVSFVGEVSHARALSYQRAARVNVMTWDGPDDGRSGQMMSSKLFEYVAAGRSILALVPESCAAARTLTRVRGAQVLPPHDAARLAAALSVLADGDGRTLGVLAADYQSFTRRDQARRLAEILSSAAGQ